MPRSAPIHTPPYSLGRTHSVTPARRMFKQDFIVSTLKGLEESNREQF
jgi:hypothetical protein